jgi:hypothetical protein
MKLYDEFKARIILIKALDIEDFRLTCMEDVLDDMQEASNNKKINQEEFTDLYGILMF